MIYYNTLEDGTIWLLLIYAKNKHENIPAHLLKAIKKKILDIATDKDNLVLDAFLGAGCTASTAHKINRRYIVGCHIIEYAVKRLQLVIEGEQGGISSDVHWESGGGFEFYDAVKRNNAVLHSDNNSAASYFRR